MNPADALEILKKCSEGFLGTLEDGFPHLSAVGYFFEEDGTKFGKLHFWMSGLARHTRNLLKDSRAGFMAVEPGEKTIYERRRVSCRGSFKKVTDAACVQNFKDRYVKAFPHLSMLTSFPDFGLFEMEILEVYMIAGFGKAEAFR